MYQQIRSTITLCALAAFIPFVALQAAETRNITIDDLMALKSVKDPRVSPDGDWVAYTATGYDEDEDEDKGTSQIFMVSRDGSETIPLSAPESNASTPRWSPDSKTIAFLAARGGDDAKAQVWLLDRRGGEAQQHTKVTQGVDDYQWSPDSSRMLLTITDMTEVAKARAAAEERGEKLDEERPQPAVIDRLEFKKDYVGYLDRTRPHFYVYAEGDEAPRQVTFGDYDDEDPVWSPDGKTIAFVSNRTDWPDNNDNTDIFTVTVDAKDPAKALKQVTTNPGTDGSPAWSPDGKTIAHVALTAVEKMWYASNHLATIPASGGKATVHTTAIDRNVMDPAYTPDGASIRFVMEDSAEQQLVSMDVATGKISRLVSGEVALGSEFHQGLDGSAVFGLSRLKHPAEIHMLADGALSQLSTVNAGVLNGITLATVENVTFPSAEGVEVEGFLYTPPGYKKGKKIPTILRIHGGPTSQFDFTFDEFAQLYAANGYAVIMTNPRGSTGYGEDFAMALFAQWGVPDFVDVMAGVDYVIDRGIADPKRLGVGGWSYGGILTNYVITKTNRFAGAVTGASEVNFLANYGHDIYQKAWEAELGLPWESPDKWDAINIWNDLKNITTPTLVIGGGEDWNVPILNSEQIYQVLKRRGIDTQLVVYPGEFHGIRRPSFVRDRYGRFLDWYDRTVK